MSVDVGATATYVYDGENRRVRKTAPNGDTLYFYDPSGRLLTEITPDGEGSATGKDYLYLPDGPVARVDWSLPNSGGVYSCVGDDLEACTRPRDESLLFYHNNYLGTPIALTDQDGSVMWRVEYLPFGELFSNDIGYVQNNLRFPGQYFDEETELQQNWFRDYSPRTGRYQEADPIGLVGGLNPYAYVGSDPINSIDPWGLDPLEIIFWAPVGRGRSSFGHVSEHIGDVSYSFGENGNDVRSFSQYLALQDFRNGHGLIIDVPPESLTRIGQMLRDFNDEYGSTKNNCTTPIQNALGNEFGFTRQGTPTASQGSMLPFTLEEAIRRNFNIVGTTFYPRIPRGIK